MRWLGNSGSINDALTSSDQLCATLKDDLWSVVYHPQGRSLLSCVPHSRMCKTLYGDDRLTLARTMFRPWLTGSTQ